VGRGPWAVTVTVTVTVTELATTGQRDLFLPFLIVGGFQQLLPKK
jgi:hypothetical protein